MDNFGYLEEVKNLFGQLIRKDNIERNYIKTQGLVLQYDFIPNIIIIQFLDYACTKRK